MSRSFVGNHRMMRAAKEFSKAQLRRRGLEISSFHGSLASVRAQQLRHTDLLLDVGANEGQFASMVRQQGYSQRIISFEPGQQAYNSLSRRAGPDVLWEIRKLALGETPGHADLHIANNLVSSSLLPMNSLHVEAAPRSAESHVESVKVSTIGALVPEFGSASLFLKLDVQGFELPVLRGAGGSLASFQAIQMELSTRLLYEGQATYLDTLGYAVEAGFVIVAMELGFSHPATGHLLQFDVLLKNSDSL